MKYTLETKILFSMILGSWQERETFTMNELGFTQEQINDYTESEIENELQSMYEDWQQNFLDSGWSVID